MSFYFSRTLEYMTLGGLGLSSSLFWSYFFCCRRWISLKRSIERSNQLQPGTWFDNLFKQARLTRRLCTRLIIYFPKKILIVIYFLNWRIAFQQQGLEIFNTKEVPSSRSNLLLSSQRESAKVRFKIHAFMARGHTVIFVKKLLLHLRKIFPDGLRQLLCTLKKGLTMPRPLYLPWQP
jgi:hypothetical protein